MKVQIEKVLDLAGLESRKSVMDLQLTDFRPNLLSLATSFSKLSNLENIDFEYELQDGAYWILCEPNHLENAINNLLDNAKKYSEGKPVIRLTAVTKGNQMYVEVKDNGIGIAENELKNVFKKYHRIISGDLHKVRGYGLGLSYVKQVIRLHKGKVFLKSKINEGTVVTIKVPHQLPR